MLSYSIGDVSRVLGMTTAALHFYEKEGIIAPPKVDSGRRYYEDVDVNRLLSAKKYRAMGVPVREIAKQFSVDGMTGEQVVARMKEKRAEVALQARLYSDLTSDLDALIALSEEGIESVGKVDIRRVEDMICFVSTSGGRIPLNKDEQAATQRWLEAMPAVSLSISREMDAPSARPSMIISASRARDFGIEPDGRAARLFPGGMALHAVVVCGEEQYDDPDVIFKPILAFAQEHRFVQNGAMWGRMLLADCSNGIRRYYFDTYMPFK